jgi:hypothetical protein
MATNNETERRENVVLAFVTSIFWIVLIMIGGVRAEESRTFRNDRGQVTGQATTRGQQTGHADRRPDGSTNYYDERGRMIGSSRGR